MEDDPAAAQRRSLLNALRVAELDLPQLWLRYFCLGGNAGLEELEGYIENLLDFDAVQRDILAHAVNERLDELQPARRVPYSRTVREPVPDTGPLAALVGLLREAAHMGPDRMPEVVRATGAALGVRAELYLVDTDEHLLFPVTADDEAPREPLPVDTTLAGLAFQRVQTLASEGGEDLRLWVPLVDGVQRLGVLGIGVTSAEDLRDPNLRAHCMQFASLLGHVLAGKAGYGDELARIRQGRPRSVAAELLYGVLPPLTAAVDGFVLAGRVEPNARAGGDVFDYALSESAVSMALFDAMGHSLGAGLMAATAIAAYRVARRDGQGLVGQAAFLDEVLAAQFPDSFCTGVLLELDLRTGRLRYLSAGHPAPLLLREGRVVKRLGVGRRAPFGLSDLHDTGVSVAEEHLQRGDWLVIYTDGLVEARDEEGNFFGDDRLADFVVRGAAAQQPPPETVRRLMSAVLTHQQGRLQDDATVLLASWYHHGAGEAFPAVFKALGSGEND